MQQICAVLLDIWGRKISEERFACKVSIYFSSEDMIRVELHLLINRKTLWSRNLLLLMLMVEIVSRKWKMRVKEGMIIRLLLDIQDGQLMEKRLIEMHILTPTSITMSHLSTTEC